MSNLFFGRNLENGHDAPSGVNIVFLKKMHKALPKILDRYFAAFLGLVFS